MKRFYKEARVEAVRPGWRVVLDGRGIKTAAGAPQAVGSQTLAEAMAREWAEQGEEIDPNRFPLRDLADYAIDIVDPDPERAVDALLLFAETDTLCYRADPDDALHLRQLELWEPLLTAAERRWDVHFERISGIVHQAQPAATLLRIMGVLLSRLDFELAALHTLASLAASLVVALAAIEPGADAEALWNAANLEEDWQADLWGKDAEAEARRARRFATFAAAVRFARLARGEDA